MVINTPIERAIDIAYSITDDALKAQNRIADRSKIEVVWFCYILSGWKSLLISKQRPDIYYEITFNHIRNEHYIDVYEKRFNKVIR